jgi:hypothetical protein
VAALVDVDDLKSVNHEQGHRAGDRLLRDVGRAREPDALIRSGASVGGDGFLCARPDVTPSESRRVPAVDVPTHLTGSRPSHTPETRPMNGGYSGLPRAHVPETVTGANRKAPCRRERERHRQGDRASVLGRTAQTRRDRVLFLERRLTATHARDKRAGVSAIAECCPSTANASTSIGRDSTAR